jgi:hypothetical protein
MAARSAVLGATFDARIGNARAVARKPKRKRCRYFICKPERQQTILLPFFGSEGGTGIDSRSEPRLWILRLLAVPYWNVCVYAREHGI